MGCYIRSFLKLGPNLKSKPHETYLTLEHQQTEQPETDQEFLENLQRP